MHTDARSAKKDVISTKPQKAMGAREHSPEKTKKKKKKKGEKAFAPPPCAVTLAKCRRYRGMLSCADRASEGGGQSHLSCVRVGSVPSLGGKGEPKNIYFFELDFVFYLKPGNPCSKPTLSAIHPALT